MGMIRVIAVLPFSGLKPFKKKKKRKKRMTSTHSPLSSNVVPGPVCGQCLVPEPVSSVSADKEQLLGGITAIKQWQHQSHHYFKKKKFKTKSSHGSLNVEHFYATLPHILFPLRARTEATVAKKNCLIRR